MPSEQKKLPLSIQSFEQLITEGAVYVDKTKYIYELLKPGFGAYFLSRPRRFGKSLLVSTLEAIFKNKRELFKGFWIYDSEYVWEEYPVIKFDMSTVDKDTDEHLKTGLEHAVRDNAENYGINLEEDTPAYMFKSLILKLKEKYRSQVVVLIDEYDSAIIKHISNPAMARKNIEILHDFYSIVKAEGASLRFVFLTGVSKFAKTSIFSGLNNLINISMQEKYSPLLGLTQEELEVYFPEYIKAVAEKHSLTEKEVREKIKFWYNGYRFSEAEVKVYNPFSTLSLFEAKKFTNYWFETGTPTFLTELIKSHDPDLQKFESEIRLMQNSFNSYEVDNLPLYPILYDTGYLTIKDYSVRNNITAYSLIYPNFEVKSSLLDNLLVTYTDSKKSETASNMVLAVEDAILANDLDKFFSLLKSYFASIPYDLIPEKKLGEKYFQLIFYLLMRVSSFRVNTEDRTNLGRIDLVLESDTSVYLFELKVNSSAKTALEQIKEKKYYEKYLNVQKELLIIGVNFSLEERNVTDWVVESIGL
jgi:hypothetical protein